MPAGSSNCPLASIHIWPLRVIVSVHVRRSLFLFSHRSAIQSSPVVGCLTCFVSATVSPYLLPRAARMFASEPHLTCCWAVADDAAIASATAARVTSRTWGFLHFGQTALNRVRYRSPMVLLSSVSRLLYVGRSTRNSRQIVASVSVAKTAF